MAANEPMNRSPARKTNRTWTDKELALLIKMRDLNQPVQDIAVALNRPPDAVYAKCKRLVKEGRLSRQKAPSWSSQDIAVLKDMTLSDAIVAKMADRTVTAVKTKRIKLCLYRREPNPWSEGQDQALIELREKGLSSSEIASTMRRTASAISNRVYGLIVKGRLKALPKLERSRRAGAATAESRKDRWTVEERRKLIDLWKSGCTAQEISSMSARTISAIGNELGKLRSAGLITHLSTEEANKRATSAHRRYSEKQYAVALESVRSLPNTKSAGYIIGVLYGDGFISIQGNRGSIGLKSTNESFCASFAQALEETFGRKVRLLSRIEPLKQIGGYEYKDVQYYEAFLHSVHLGQAIRKVFGLTDEQSWYANPSYFMQIGERFIDGVIQGFFDAEGSFMRGKGGKYYTTACSMNQLGLESIRDLLKLRGYRPTINCDKRGQWRVGITRQAEACRFAAEIGSRIDYKSERMKACLSKVQV